MLSANFIQQVKEQAFMGVPTKFNDICSVYPFKVKEIVEMGSNLYYGRLGLLLLNEVEIVNTIKEKTGEDIPIEDVHPLSYLIQSAAANDNFLLELQETFATFLKEEILVLPKINAVLVGPPQEKRLITEDNFVDLQNILKIQNRREIKEPPPENESPGQRKMRLLREKVAEVKRKQAQKNGEEQSFVDLLEIASVFGIDIENCSLYAFYGLIRRYQLREKWNQDLQMVSVGADPKKLKMKYWGETAPEE